MLIQILLIGVSVSMDAFAVSIGKGLTVKKLRGVDAFKTALWFGGFQALFPLLGYFAASTFSKYVTAVDHWIIFGLLALIGGNMILESLSKDEDPVGAALDPKTRFLMAVATSIDALAVGITFALVPVRIVSAGALVNTLIAVVVIGLTTFAISCAGVKVGNVFGTKYKARAEFAGGAILILLGLNILLEHFGVL